MHQAKTHCSEKAQNGISGGGRCVQCGDIGAGPARATGALSQWTHTGRAVRTCVKCYLPEMLMRAQRPELSLGAQVGALLWHYPDPRLPEEKVFATNPRACTSRELLPAVRSGSQSPDTSQGLAKRRQPGPAA